MGICLCTTAEYQNKKKQAEAWCTAKDAVDWIPIVGACVQMGKAIGEGDLVQGIMGGVGLALDVASIVSIFCGVGVAVQGAKQVAVQGAKQVAVQKAKQVAVQGAKRVVVQGAKHVAMQVAVQGAEKGTHPVSTFVNMMM